MNCAFENIGFDAAGNEPSRALFTLTLQLTRTLPGFLHHSPGFAESPLLWLGLVWLVCAASLSLAMLHAVADPEVGADLYSKCGFEVRSNLLVLLFGSSLHTKKH